MGRHKFTVLAQGLCSSSDIFNYLKDGSLCHDNSGALKNMDVVMIHGKTLIELEEKLENFLKFCREKNLKLKPTKLNILEQGQFGGAVILSELVRNEQVVCVLPKGKIIQVFFNLKKPQNEEDIHSFCGMLASLQQWSPNVPLNIQS